MSIKELNGVKMINSWSFPRTKDFKYYDHSVTKLPGIDETPKLKLNKNEFRCGEFVKSSDEEIILFAGCSVTFGIGLYEDEIWTNILASLIGKNKNYTYNISRPGWSVFDIIFNVFLYLNNFKKPSEIYLLLPDEGRLSGYSVVENVNGHFVLLPNHKKEDLDLVEEIISANAFHVENYIFMLEEYCRIQDIKLFISTYNENNSTNKQHDILNNYYPYNGDSEKRFLKKYQEENSTSDFIFFARDKKHQGIGYHSYWADMFYKIRQESL